MKNELDKLFEYFGDKPVGEVATILMCAVLHMTSSFSDEDDRLINLQVLSEAMSNTLANKVGFQMSCFLGSEPIVNGEGFNKNNVTLQ